MKWTRSILAELATIRKKLQTAQQNRRYHRTGLPFREWCFHFLPNYFTLAPSPLHEDLFATHERIKLERGARESRIAPRSSGKSAIISTAYPLYGSLEGFEEYIVLTSDTGEQAKKYLGSIRDELHANRKIRKAYPWIKGKWAEDTTKAIELPNGVRIEALGTGSKLRGRRHREHRPSHIVADDPQNTMHMVSELQRTRSWDWLTKDVCNAGGPKTNIVVAGTALHQECIVCRLETPAYGVGWKTRKYKAIMEWPARMDLWNEWERILHDPQSTPDDAMRNARLYYEQHEAEMVA